MVYDISHKIDFGKYRGLTIKDIYQGTINLNRAFLAKYLNEILNIRKIDTEFFREIAFIEEFEITEEAIIVFGQIFNENLPQTTNNRVVLGNIQEKFNSYINLHFNENFFGILLDLKKFNGFQEVPFQIGGDPEYLLWCQRTIDDFQISTDCKCKLDQLPIARLKGIKLFYIGNESYEYQPLFEFEYFNFSRL